MDNDIRARSFEIIEGAGAFALEAMASATELGRRSTRQIETVSARRIASHAYNSGLRCDIRPIADHEIVAWRKRLFNPDFADLADFDGLDEAPPSYNVFDDLRDMFPD